MGAVLRSLTMPMLAIVLVFAALGMSRNGPGTDATDRAIFSTAAALDARRLGGTLLSRANAYAVVCRSATVAGIGTKFGSHTF